MGPSEQKSIKNCEEKGAWAYPGIWGLPKIFKYHLLSQELVKLLTSNSVHTFTGWIGTKAH